MTHASRFSLTRIATPPHAEPIRRRIRSRRRPWMMIASAMCASVTMISGLSGLLGLPSLSDPPKLAHAAAVAGKITGLAFRDYNADGVQNANEPGVPGITVTAYDKAGTASGTATTLSDGTYAIVTTGTGPYRVEFTSIPSFLQSGPTGANSGTTVQFVPDGGASNVSLGLLNPRDYTSPNARIATSIFRGGDQTSGNATIVSHPYFAASRPPDNLTTHATDVQAGSTYGLAYRRSTRDLFASAYTKRGAGFGPGGIGAIYKITASGVVSVLVNLGSAVGTFTRKRSFALDGTPFDDEAYALVGKSGFGGLDIADDEQALWTINLADRSLYKIDLAVAETAPGGTAGVTKIGPPPDPGCVTGVARPFGVSVKDGVIYVGGVCTGENSPTTPAKGMLEAFVYRYTPSGGWNPSPIIRFSLAYPRTCSDVWSAYQPAVPCAKTGQTGASAQWRPWYDALPNTSGGYAFSAQAFDGSVADPQPMLTGIAFDGSDMILGFRDRFADQIGWQDPGPGGKGSSPFGQNNLSVISAGDILRAGSSGPGQWQIEGNASGTTFGPGAHVGDGSGPCADAAQTQCGEFYNDNFNLGADTAHDETTLGALAQVPGAGEVVSTLFDPFDVYTGGTVQFSRSTGQPVRANTVYKSKSPTTPSQNGEPFSKANGLGDLEIISDPAPIEIGNRVWLDTNGNGIQDPGEPGIPDVTVRLYRPGVGADCIPGTADDNQSIARAVTNANGEYYFRTGSGPDTQLDAVGLVDGSQCPLQPNGTYEIRLDNAGDYSPDNPLAGLTLTAKNARLTPGASRLNDSDASYVGTTAIITYTTGPQYGTSDHTLDFGFVPGLSLGNEVWFDTNNNGRVDPLEAGIAGVTLTLFADTNGSGVIDPVTATPIATRTTNSAGFYLFTGLKPGGYAVCIPPSNFAASGALVGRFSSGVSMGANGVITETPPPAPDTNVDNDDNGAYQTSGFCTSGVASGVIHLAGNEPTDEVPANAGATLPGTTPGLTDPTPNNDSNLTLDFGFYRATIGNQVWFDTNNNGVRDATENGAPNVTVKLLAAGGVTEIPVGPDGILGTADDAPGGMLTDASGHYTFTVPQGSYIVHVTPPAGYVSSSGASSQYEPAPNPNNNIDDDDDGTLITTGAFSGTIASQVLTLTAGTVPGVANAIDNATGTTRNPTLDFGLVKPIDPNSYSLGNRVWLDSGVGAHGNNGIMDADEIGMPGITVTLYFTGAVGGPTPVQTTTTDVHGYYRFDGLVAGDYFIEVPLLPGFSASTGAGNETNPNNDADRNNNCVAVLPGVVRTNPITLGPGPSEPVGEPDVLPEIGQGTRDDHANMTLDCGLIAPPMSIGNQVFDDRNNDGAFDPAAEVGLNGVVLNLYTDLNSDGDVSGLEFDTPMLTTTTYASGTLGGFYLFKGIPPGTYVVEIACSNFDPGGILAGYTSSSGKVGSKLGPYEPSGNPNDPNFEADTLDVGSLVTTARGKTCIRTQPFTMVPGTEPTVIGSGHDTSGKAHDGIADEVEIPQFVNDFTTPDANSNLTIDFGVFKPYSIGNRVWLDKNGNGQLDPLEPGLPGVNVRLYSITNTLLTTTTTDSQGYYRFDFLTSGQYVVEVEDPVNPNPLPPPGSGYGFMRVSPVHGGLSVDSVNKGVMTTTVSGKPATRSLTITLGNAASGDTEPVGETDLESNLEGAAIDGRYNATIDFGFYEPLEFGDRIFDDATNKGRRVSGEKNGIVSATLKLYKYDPTGGVTGICTYQNPISTTRPSTAVATFSDYHFTDLAPGAYVVEVVLDASLKDYTSSSGIQGSPYTGPYENLNGNVIDPNDGPGGGINNDDNGWTCPNGRVVSLPFVLSSRDENALDSVTNPDVNNTLDFGFFRPLSIGNLVWNDLNNNGIWDPGEPPIPGVKVSLAWDANHDGVLDASELAAPILTTTTDVSGLYVFKGLGAGTYVVELDASNFAPGGALSGFRSSTGAGIGMIGPFEPPPDLSTNTADNHDNGTFDPATKTIRSAPIKLAAGTEPKGESPNNDPSTPDKNNNLTVDFGVFQPFSIGNRVWLDADSDGQLTPGEPGLPNVLVNLYARDTITKLAQTTTDAHGYYRFDGLRAGDYIVGLDASNFFTASEKSAPPLLGYVSSAPDDISASSGIDNNDNGLGVMPDRVVGIRSDIVTLGPGGIEPTGETDLAPGPDPQGADDAFANMTIDFGVHLTATLGNRVWIDTNRNGIADPSEPPVPGVKISLWSMSNTVVATTTTDAAGYYTFSNIAPNTYQISLDLPPGYTYTVQTTTPNADNVSHIDPRTGRTPPVTLHVGDVNLTIDIGIITNPTAVTLSRFRASAQADGVNVEWQTMLERETFGFVLLRGESDDVALAIQVTPDLIVAHGTTGGASYSFVDHTADPTRRYWYWLREVELSGGHQTYGPVMLDSLSLTPTRTPLPKWPGDAVPASGSTSAPATQVAATPLPTPSVGGVQVNAIATAQATAQTPAPLTVQPAEQPALAQGPHPSAALTGTNSVSVPVPGGQADAQIGTRPDAKGASADASNASGKSAPAPMPTDARTSVLTSAHESIDPPTVSGADVGAAPSTQPDVQGLEQAVRVVRSAPPAQAQILPASASTPARISAGDISAAPPLSFGGLTALSGLILAVLGAGMACAATIRHRLSRATRAVNAGRQDSDKGKNGRIVS